MTIQMSTDVGSSQRLLGVWRFASCDLTAKIDADF